MVIDTRRAFWEKAVKSALKTKITVFHCFNAMNDIAIENSDCEIRSLRLPCSGLNRETVLLKAFEAGADAVVVLTCPLGHCRFVQGNLRAAKRVARVKKILDELGLDGRRLNIYHIPEGDQYAVKDILTRTADTLAELGPAF